MVTSNDIKNELQEFLAISMGDPYIMPMFFKNPCKIA